MGHFCPTGHFCPVPGSSPFGVCLLPVEKRGPPQNKWDAGNLLLFLGAAWEAAFFKGPHDRGRACGPSARFRALPEALRHVDPCVIFIPNIRRGLPRAFPTARPSLAFPYNIQEKPPLPHFPARQARPNTQEGTALSRKGGAGAPKRKGPVTGPSSFREALRQPTAPDGRALSLRRRRRKARQRQPGRRPPHHGAGKRYIPDSPWGP